ncbi:MAG: Lrp/AsnC family transcriptional regulator [Candidatus Altiarchaeales archaeon]|nr:Lrp/AsnC family transcriptional regulator [Candidatus Altiarchaeales archaeon]
MDQKDVEILEMLEEDGRIPVGEMAGMLDLTEGDVEKRINRLKKKNVIRKFKTSIDWKKAGKRQTSAAIQVKVVPQRRTGFSQICEEISRDSRVKDVFVVTGEYDLILLVEAADMDEISEFVTEKLAPKKDIVGTYSHIILREFKRDGVVLSEDKSRRLKVSL